jgi:protein-tyrosine sulfotransferase
MSRFPEASIIHIVRDGRDVVCSMRQHPDWRWIDGAWQKVLVPRSVRSYAQRWLADVASGLARRDDARYVEVRYEDLVADPASALRAICDGIGASVDAAWLDAVGRREEPATVAPDGHTKRPDYEGAVSAASVGRWRHDLSAEDQREVERLCGPRLRELGYEA